jgi:hypothetical protein
MLDIGDSVVVPTVILVIVLVIFWVQKAMWHK